MAKKLSYRDSLKREMEEVINRLDLSPLHKQSMKSRWLDQVLWMESKADRSRKRYYRLRLTTIVGGVILPALVSLNFGSFENQFMQRLESWLPFITFGLSQAIAISAAIEEFGQYGKTWQQYRKTAEGLKSEGWQFLQLSGVYRSAQSHEQAYTAFATRVERTIKQDVEVYITEVVRQQLKEDEAKQGDWKGQSSSASSANAPVQDRSLDTVIPLERDPFTPGVDTALQLAEASSSAAFLSNSAASRDAVEPTSDSQLASVPAVGGSAVDQRQDRPEFDVDGMGG